MNCGARSKNFSTAFWQRNRTLVLGRIERQRLLEQLTAEIMGFGPLEPLLRDNSIDEIMVNGPNMIYIERHGKIERVSARFDSEMHVYRIIDRIVAPLGRRVDEGQPFVDARLPNGSRVNVIIPPLALNGPTITIRKFATTPLDRRRSGTTAPFRANLRNL